MSSNMTKTAEATVYADKSPSLDSKDLETSPQEKTEIKRSLTGIRWVLVVFSVLSSVFLFALDNSIVADVQPTIVAAFGDVEKLPWLSVAFALGAAATTLIWAAIFTAFDSKYSYIASVLLFEIGSVICGASNKMDALIFGRALAGLGGSGIYVGVLTLLSALTTPTERPIYVASTGLVWGLGSVLGPIIGGAFVASAATWRWSFYINIVVAGVCAPVYVFMIPPVDPQPGRSQKDRVVNFDFVGAILIMGTFGCGITGLSFGGSSYQWNSSTIIALLVVSVVLLAAFIVQQVWCLGTSQANRLLPVQYFANRTLCLQFCLNALAPSPIFVPVYFLSLYFQFARGDDSVQAAIRLFPFLCMLVFFSLVNGAAMSKKGYYAPWYLVASAAALAGSTLMFTVDEFTSQSRILGYSALLGAGAGATFQTGFIVAQAVVTRSEMSSAVAFINLAQIGGLVISLTVSNSIFLNLAQKYLAVVLPMASNGEILAAVSGTGSQLIASMSPEVQAAAVGAVSQAISRTYLLPVATSALSFLISLTLKWECVMMEV